MSVSRSTRGVCAPLSIKVSKVSQSGGCVASILVNPNAEKRHRQDKSPWIASIMKDRIYHHPNTTLADSRTAILWDFGVDVSYLRSWNGKELHRRKSTEVGRSPIASTILHGPTSRGWPGGANMLGPWRRWVILEVFLNVGPYIRSYKSGACYAWREAIYRKVFGTLLKACAYYAQSISFLFSFTFMEL